MKKKVTQFPTEFKGIGLQRESTVEDRWGPVIKELPIYADRKEYYYRKEMEEEQKAYEKDKEKEYWKGVYECGGKSMCPFEAMLRDKVLDELAEMEKKGVFDLERYKELLDILKGGE